MSQTSIAEYLQTQRERHQRRTTRKVDGREAGGTGTRAAGGERGGPESWEIIP